MNYYDNPYPYQMYNQYRLSSTDELNEGLYKWVKVTFTNGTEKEVFIFYLDKPSGAVFMLSFPTLTTSQVNVNDIKSLEVLNEPPKFEEEEAAAPESEGQNGDGGQEEQEQPDPFEQAGQGSGGEPGSGSGTAGGQGSTFGQMPGSGQNGGMQEGQGSPFGQMPGSSQNGGMQGGQGSPFGQMPGSDQSGMPFGGQRYQHPNHPVFYNPYSYYWQQ